MVSITLSVPEQVRAHMKMFPEVNWSGFIRLAVESKVKKLVWREQMLKKLESKEEQELIKWSVELGRKAKKGRFAELKKKGLL